MNGKWPASSPGIPEQFKQTFSAYFGDPDAEVAVGELQFQKGAPPKLTECQTRCALVRAVLNCVSLGLETKTVRLYYGGGSIIPNVEAYTPSLVEIAEKKGRNEGRINVHLSIDFFRKHNDKATKGVASSRAGVLIHELTHALAGTQDEGAFSHHQCKGIAKRKHALTNAQSYACFLEDAFG